VRIQSKTQDLTILNSERCIFYPRANMGRYEQLPCLRKS